MSGLVPAVAGNSLNLQHGAYAKLHLQPRAEELAGQIRQAVPAYSPADEPAIQTLALVLAQLERASRALAEVALAAPEDNGRAALAGYTKRAEALDTLRRDTRGWANTARRFMADLGMTPVSRAKLGLDITRARGEALRQHLEAVYGADDAA